MGLLEDQLFLDLQTALAGRFSLERELGRGGMGVVYLARDVALDRRVAIKVLPPSSNVDVSERESFVREARLAGRLNHPNTVPVHAVEVVAGLAIFVMAFIDGETAATLVARRGPIPPLQAARILRDLAFALDHAHSHGIVHRDVKPANVLLERDSGRTVLVDFGIALLRDMERAETGTPGTVHFMSPEQIAGEELDGRSDIYSLGLVAHHLLTGSSPFDRASAVESMHLRLSTDAPSVAAKGIPVPAELARVVDRCLARRPGDRFKTAGELADALTHVIERSRDVPAPLAEYLEHTERLSGLRLSVTLFVTGFASLIFTYLYVGPDGSFRWVIAPHLCAAIIAIPALPFIWRVLRLRRLQKAGYGFRDLLSALDERERRARSVMLASGGASTLRRAGWLRRGWLASISVMCAYAVAWAALGGLESALAGMPAFGLRLFPGIPLINGLLYFASFGLPLVLGGAGWRGGVATGADQRFWAGTVGRIMFRMAGIGLPSVAGAAVMTDRTELMLDAAIQGLLPLVPRAFRQLVPEVRRVASDLEAAALDVRRRRAALALRVQPGVSGGAEPSPEAKQAYQEADEQLVLLVGAMEAIRLDLIRLGTGATDSESLASVLRRAEEIGREVSRLIAAHREVDVVLGHQGTPA